MGRRSDGATLIGILLHVISVGGFHAAPWVAPALERRTATSTAPPAAASRPPRPAGGWLRALHTVRPFTSATDSESEGGTGASGASENQTVAAEGGADATTVVATVDISGSSDDLRGKEFAGGGQAAVLSPDKTNVGAPPAKPERLMSVETMLSELREIQGQGNRTYCIIGSRHCTMLHQQLIELLSYALVLSDNHVYTSGAPGTNAAVIRGALRAERPELLTVVLPQSLHKQPEEARELIQMVQNVQTSPGNDKLSLADASKKCNQKLIEKVDHLIIFAFHTSHTVVQTAEEAQAKDKLVTTLFLD